VRSIATTKPNELCAELHERMPEVLRPRPGPVWLGQEQADPKALKALLVS
jgi:putative SOS response-associated peptidase YedK